MMQNEPISSAVGGSLPRIEGDAYVSSEIEHR